MHDLCLILSTVVSRLSAKDQTFARDLIANAEKYGRPTEKQAEWMKILYTRALTGGSSSSSQAGVEIGSTTAIMEMFDKAGQHLKRPAIKLVDADIAIKVKPAKRTPGTLYVTEATTDEYLGKVNTEGRFLSRGAGDKAVPMLRRFAAEPAKTAAESGRMTGKCSFCRKTLTDSRSTSVGYGPDCASHYGLPWG